MKALSLLVLSAAAMLAAAGSVLAGELPREGEVVVESLDNDARKCGLSEDGLRRAVGDALAVNMVRPVPSSEFKAYMNLVALPMKEGCAVHVRLQAFYHAAQRASWESRARTRVVELCDESTLLVGDQIPQRVATAANRQVRDCVNKIMQE